MQHVVIAAVLAAMVVHSACARREAAAPKPTQPNILLIVSEDNGPELGSYGSRWVQTPRLDALAGAGVRFKNAFVPQAGCSQSRAALLTGLYPHQNGQIGLATWMFGLYRTDTPNLVRSLKSTGYRTGIIGKLHINPAEAFPFDFERIPGSNFRREGLDRYARFAGEFMNGGDSPFFLYVNYPDAHRPFLRQVEGLPRVPVNAPDVPPLPYMGLDSPVLRRDTADYYNSISRLDTLVGDLLDALAASGKAQSTIVVYIGDHGADLLRGKRTSYEGGLRVPLIVRWPGHHLAGQVRDELVSTLDLMPTLLEASGASPVPGLQGQTLAAMIAGQAPAWREHLFTEYHLHSNHNYYPQRAVRDQRYKLIQNLMPGRPNPGHAFTIAKFVGPEEVADAVRAAPQDVREAYETMAVPPEFELYDLAEDPFEFRNLAADPRQAGTLEELQRALHEWRVRTLDPFLDPANTERLRAEVEATFRDGAYQKPEFWEYPKYLAPE